MAVLHRHLESIRTQETSLTGMEFGAYAGAMGALPRAASLDEFLSVMPGSAPAGAGTGTIISEVGDAGEVGDSG